MKKSLVEVLVSKAYVDGSFMLGSASLSRLEEAARTLDEVYAMMTEQPSQEEEGQNWVQTFHCNKKERNEVLDNDSEKRVVQIWLKYEERNYIIVRR